MRHRYAFLAVVLFVLSTAAHLPARDAAPATPWRPIALIKDGKLSHDWTQVGYGKFTVDGDAVRTDCDERGMGLLVYKKERLGNCQIRIVYKPEHGRSNSGVYVRMDDGILDRAGKESVAIKR